MEWNLLRTFWQARKYTVLVGKRFLVADIGSNGLDGFSKRLYMDNG